MKTWQIRPMRERFWRLYLGISSSIAMSCVPPEEASRIDLSSEEIHLSAVFGGHSTRARLTFCRNSDLFCELVGVESVPWLGLDLTPQTLEYEFYVKDTLLPEARNVAHLRIDAYEEVLPTLGRFVESRDLRVIYDIRNEITFQGDVPPFHAAQSGVAPRSETVRIVGERGAWSVVPSDAWLTVAEPAGRGISEVTVGVEPSALPRGPGTFTALLQATGAKGGSTSLPVTVIVNAPRFVLPLGNVSLASDDSSGVQQPSLVPVLDSGGIGIPFVAEPQEPWLVVEGGATTGGTLSVAANPQGLGPGLHEGTIVLRADATQGPWSFDTPEPASISVALYVSEKPLSPKIAAQLPISANSLVADPYRPYAYVVVDEKAVEAYDIESGLRVARATLPSPVVRSVIALDGSKMFSLERDAGVVHALDLPMLRPSRTFAVDGAYTELAWLSCGGRSALWTYGRDLTLFDVETGEPLTVTGNVSAPVTSLPPRMTPSRKGDRVVFLGLPTFEMFEIGCSTDPLEPVRLRLRFRAMGPETSFVKGGPVRISPDSRRVCIAEVCVDPETGAPLANLPTALAEALASPEFSQLVFGPTGSLYIGDANGKVRQFDPSWQSNGEVQLVPTRPPGSSLPRYTLEVTGDERRLLALDEYAVLHVSNRAD